MDFYFFAITACAIGFGYISTDDLRRLTSASWRAASIEKALQRTIDTWRFCARNPGAGETEIQGVAVMARKNPHIGSSFESWLEEAGIREEVTAAAIKAVIARQLASEMKKKITKQRMAELMKTSRAQIDRLLDPENGSATIESPSARR